MQGFSDSSYSRGSTNNKKLTNISANKSKNRVLSRDIDAISSNLDENAKMMNSLIDFLPSDFLFEIMPDFLSFNEAMNTFSNETDVNHQPQALLPESKDVNEEANQKSQNTEKIDLQTQNMNSSLSNDIGSISSTINNNAMLINSLFNSIPSEFLPDYTEISNPDSNIVEFQNQESISNKPYSNIESSSYTQNTSIHYLQMPPNSSPKTAKSFQNRQLHISTNQSYQPSLNQSYQPSLKQSYQPSLNQSYQPSLNQSYQSSLNQSYQSSDSPLNTKNMNIYSEVLLNLSPRYGVEIMSLQDPLDAAICMDSRSLFSAQSLSTDMQTFIPPSCQSRKNLSICFHKKIQFLDCSSPMKSSKRAEGSQRPAADSSSKYCFSNVHIIASIFPLQFIECLPYRFSGHFTNVDIPPFSTDKDVFIGIQVEDNANDEH